MNALAALRELVACADAAGPSAFPGEGYRWHDALAAARAVLADHDAEPATDEVVRLRDALRAVQDRIADVATIIGERGHYADAGFLQRSAERCAHALAGGWFNDENYTKDAIATNAGVAKEVDAAPFADAARPVDLMGAPMFPDPTDEQLDRLIGLLNYHGKYCLLREGEQSRTMLESAAALTALRTRAVNAEREAEKLQDDWHQAMDSERAADARAEQAERDLAAAEARAKALHESLRKHAIERWQSFSVCAMCDKKWGEHERESHASACLAAPLAKPVEPSQEPAK